MPTHILLPQNAASAVVPLRLSPSGACRGSQASPLFHLVPTPRTLAFASRELNLDDASAPLLKLDGLSAQRTHHSRLVHVLLRRLALHGGCSNSSTNVDVCVVAAPEHGGCHAWDRICAGKRVAVIDAFDPDLTRGAGGRPVHLCPTLWRSDLSGADGRLTRIVGNAPFVFQRYRCGYATHGVLSVPYLGHLRAPTLAQQRRRPVTIAIAANHVPARVTHDAQIPSTL